MFTQETKNIIDEAKNITLNIKIDTIFPEILFYSMLKSEDIQKILAMLSYDKENFNTHLSTLKNDIYSYIDDSSFFPKKNNISDIKISNALSNIFLKLETVYISSNQLISPTLLFTQIINNEFIFQLLEKNKFSSQMVSVMKAVTTVNSRNPSLESILNQEKVTTDGSNTENVSEFSEYCVLLNTQANNGKIDPIIGRQAEIQEVIVSLARRNKNNPIIVGEPGVGKTALAEGLAIKIVEGKVPDIIKNANVYSLDLGAFIAGTQFRGDVEKRFKLIINTLEKEYEDGGCPILFIDEGHMIIGAGSAGNSSMDLSNLIKPILTKGHIRFFVATTQKEYTTIFSKDKALARRFQKIEINEPSIEDTIKILHGVKEVFEKHHNVKYDDDAIKAAVELSARYINDRHLPDKAIDILDIAGARNHIADEESKVDCIIKSNIESVISTVSKIPVTTLSKKETSNVLDLDNQLKKVVFGQEKAINSVTRAIKISKSGLANSNRPTGTFLFVGPTGVGKTELTKQLAKTMSMELIRFDMSEFSESHSVSKLIGSPPGYIGYEQGGELTSKVAKNPYSVILLDEVEKAHPKIWDVFLQVLDDGRLTDSKGETISFANTIIIMTSNAGVSDLNRNAIGFGEQSQYNDGNIKSKLKEIFKPEFLNRLTVVNFDQLKKENVVHVINKFINELNARSSIKNGINFILSDKSIVWLSDNGYDALYGARPMQRLIEDKIILPAAEIFLSLDQESFYENKEIYVDIDHNDESLLKLELRDKV